MNINLIILPARRAAMYIVVINGWIYGRHLLLLVVVVVIAASMRLVGSPLYAARSSSLHSFRFRFSLLAPRTRPCAMLGCRCDVMLCRLYKAQTAASLWRHLASSFWLAPSHQRERNNAELSKISEKESQEEAVFVITYDSYTENGNHF